MAYRDPADQRAAERRWYLANKAKVAAKKDRKRARLRELVRQAKDRPCADCGQRYPYYVMDFDHVGDDKAALVSKLVNFGATQRLLDEIAKCEVVCANCHRTRSWQRMQAAVPSPPMTDERLYFRQLLSGRDFAVGDQMAAQMVNFAYVIGDRQTNEAVLVDPAYAVAELVDLAAADGMRITGALATHHHPDHVGGTMMGWSLEGVAELQATTANGVPVHVQKPEAEFVQQVTGLAATDLVQHDPGDVLRVGEVEITLLHTPGHTPGSQCFLVDGRLVSGDTLFLDGCGRTDFPGSDPAQMFDSLQLLAGLPSDTVCYPGHRYSMASSATMAAITESNVVYRTDERERWLAMFGR